VVGFGPDAICHRGSINLQAQTSPSASDRGLDLASCQWKRRTAFILHLGPDTRELAWATLVSFLGQPADPRWSGPILEAMWAEKKIQRLDGIGCTPAAIRGSRDELLARIGRARSLGRLSFPEKNGPVLWPRYTIRRADISAVSTFPRRRSSSTSHMGRMGLMGFRHVAGRPAEDSAHGTARLCCVADYVTLGETSA
jgi:hypothetical protein